MGRKPSLQKVCAESLHKQQHLFYVVSRMLVIVAVGAALFRISAQLVTCFLVIEGSVPNNLRSNRTIEGSIGRSIEIRL
jgi:hypothetical protein